MLNLFLGVLPCSFFWISSSLLVRRIVTRNLTEKNAIIKSERVHFNYEFLKKRIQIVSTQNSEIWYIESKIHSFFQVVNKIICLSTRYYPEKSAKLFEMCILVSIAPNIIARILFVEANKKKQKWKYTFKEKKETVKRSHFHIFAFFHTLCIVFICSFVAVGGVRHG